MSLSTSWLGNRRVVTDKCRRCCNRESQPAGRAGGEPVLENGHVDLEQLVELRQSPAEASELLDTKNELQNDSKHDGWQGCPTTTTYAQIFVEH